MAQTIGYIRVSSDKQTVDNQRLAILDYCILKNVPHDTFLLRGISGKYLSRLRVMIRSIFRIKRC